MTADFVKPGAVVIDVGINRVTDRAQVVAIVRRGQPAAGGLRREGIRLVGDVHPASPTSPVALTPVPGGVGPLTIAMLLKNTLAAAAGQVCESDARPAAARGFGKIGKAKKPAGCRRLALGDREFRSTVSTTCRSVSASFLTCR